MIPTRVKQIWQFVLERRALFAMAAGVGLAFGLGIHMVNDIWTVGRHEFFRVYGGFLGAIISVAGAVFVSYRIIKSDDRRHEELRAEPFYEAKHLLSLDLREVVLNLPFETSDPQTELARIADGKDEQRVKPELMRIACQSARTPITRTALAKLASRFEVILEWDKKLRGHQAKMTKWLKDFESYGPSVVEGEKVSFLAAAIEFRAMLIEYQSFVDQIDPSSPSPPQSLHDLIELFEG